MFGSGVAEVGERLGISGVERDGLPKFCFRFGVVAEAVEGDAKHAAGVGVGLIHCHGVAEGTGGAGDVVAAEADDPSLSMVGTWPGWVSSMT